MKVHTWMFKALCATMVSAVVMTAQAGSMENDLHWPDVDHSYQKEGDFIQPDMVRRVKAGVSTKDQVRLLLTNPHFHEGYFGVTQWDYIFNFYTGKGSEYITCQYKVFFNDKMIVTSTHWKNPACEALIQEKKVVNQTHPITMSADGLFAFGKSGLSDLQASGRENLENLAGQIKKGFSNLQSIDISGHTDRIGSAASNASLSLARANTVKAYLVSQGIDGRLIRTQGMGSNKPVAFCNGPATPEVITCLMPNRRIEINVNGDK